LWPVRDSLALAAPEMRLLQQRRHRTLGYLAADKTREAMQATTCDRCHGYLKGVSSLIAMDAGELLLKDLSTLELDAAAAERGYGRPEAPGFRLDVRVVPV